MIFGFIMMLLICFWTSFYHVAGSFCVVIWSYTIAGLKSGTERKLNLKKHHIRAMLNIWFELPRARQGSAFGIVLIVCVRSTVLGSSGFSYTYYSQH